ncbi:MAG: aminomethyl-transferring glycine dehydrogenase [Methylococcales symbiont of Hymedesmia sp. n. MRB-2018]|nr:MAG: aminomethyl-transferring glycine dehydrogenase [Methylococcales symbiont of Hymedesmia sp. n. MRB-2018]
MTKTKISLSQLEMRGNFIRRHIGANQKQTNAMLKTLGFNKLDDIIESIIPKDILTESSLKLAETVSESAVGEQLDKMRSRNKVFTSLIGLGYYPTIMPEVIKRNVLENPGWYTAYTPYQAELSQGRLEALMNFQQMIIDLTGMEIANASLLDEATAAAEAIAMSRRLSKSKSSIVFIDQDCHRQTIAVVKTRAQSLGLKIHIGNPYQGLSDQSFFAILVQYPGTRGEVQDLRAIVKSAQQQHALVTVAADLLSLVILKAPAEFDVDIVIGSSQRFGVPMGYGGPHAAFFATRDSLKRSVPGRIIGVSKDNRGQIAYRMTLQTREQHIRRDKATSNICTSQVLLAVIAGFYAIYHGSQGLKLIAHRVHRYTLILVNGLKQLGYDIPTQVYFDTFTINVPSRAKRWLSHAQEEKINLRLIDKNTLAISLDETTTRQTLRTLWRLFTCSTIDVPDIAILDRQISECIPDSLLRTTTFLQHSVFEKYHSETEMMRYMRYLARKDIALDRGMIPLGSCTMKLNAATEMQAISYPEFSNMHPFVPLYQALGYQQMFDELEQMLCDLTGFYAFSLQPNAGSQGEYAGLLTIAKYHAVRGEKQRKLCLIPASAHGTNPASAVMAGFEVVVVACDQQGNISLQDLKDKVIKYQHTLAALMITYPSTHGVYESAFRQICDMIHQYGGQVYLDGANFNALVGLCRPGKIGVDVAHLNLHKTFAIPHGGGGPGAGPIGVLKHLAPFLPDHPMVNQVNPVQSEQGTIGTIAAAPWGSASILSISWAYIAMMGSYGLKQATLHAILNANYIAHRLALHYSILFADKNNHVAHECIIDCRSFKKSADITVDDIAKRLIDYGFHAPTVSFPVADTLMIEPTESENQVEIDRFCDALISIREEIKEIETGKADKKINVLKNAPHTHFLLIETWQMPYSKEQAFFPDSRLHQDKYWPPIGRIDNVYGDRHVFCSCPDIQIFDLSSDE